MIHLLLVLACATQAEEPAQPAAAPAVDGAYDDKAKAKADTPPEARSLGEGWTQYGYDFTQSDDAVISAKSLLASPDQYVDKTVRVEGRVADVCQKAGCWMVVTDEDKSMRVLMKNHNYSVAKNGSGLNCQVEGVITKKELDPERTAHFEGESEKTEVMPEKKATEGFTYELVATGVRMKDVPEG